MEKEQNFNIFYLYIHPTPHVMLERCIEHSEELELDLPLIISTVLKSLFALI